MVIYKKSKVKKINIACILGTRPEAIKMAPIIEELKRSSWAKVFIISTSQHKELLEDVLNVFDIKPDFDLEVMTHNQDLSDLTSKLIKEFSVLIKDLMPQLIIAQGDTTTAMTAALVSFYEKIKFAHIEAGLRTWDIYNPFPEEINRCLISKLTKYHFTPTEISRNNLISEKINKNDIYVCGNTVIDSVIKVALKDHKLSFKLSNKKFILITVHRRENFKKLKNIFEALKISALNNKNIDYIFPVHPNPNVNNFAKEYLQNIENFRLLKPLDYISFVTLMKKSFFIISDSGGIQEEAAALGKPILILRNNTERMEVINANVAKLIGTNTKNIIDEIDKLILDNNYYSKMSRKVFPYGTGDASKKIVEILKNNLAFQN